jgi:hypothetical protein
MKLVTVLVAMIFAMSASVYTQGRGNGQAKKTATSGPKAKSTAQPAKTAAKAETRAVKTETRAAKTTVKTEARAAKTAAKAETRAAKTETKAARKSGTTPTTTDVGSTTVVTPTTPTTQKVKNPKLEARLLALLPAGTTVQDASQGFKNWGQFVAAVHVSNNLGIPFADLKTAMTGMTPGTTVPTVPTTTPMSLGQAIQSLTGTTATDPGTLSSTKIRTEVKKAEDAATADLQRTRDRS